MVDLITPLPPVRPARAFASPMEALHAGTRTKEAREAAVIDKIVSGSVIEKLAAGDSMVMFSLDNGIQLVIKATLETPRCECFINTMGDESSISGTNHNLGDVVEVDWPNVGRKKWLRLSILNKVVGHKIARVASHDFGTSFYLSGSYMVTFSSMVTAVDRQLLLYWGLMERKKSRKSRDRHI